MPDAEEAKVKMDFTFDAKDYEGKSVVVYQTLSWNDIEVSSHKELDNAEIWNSPDKQIPNRPSFYRWVITR